MLETVIPSFPKPRDRHSEHSRGVYSDYPAKRLKTSPESKISFTPTSPPPRTPDPMSSPPPNFPVIPSAVEESI